ncbi:hypothetical protein [Ascidiaceihabitans sp.]|uniref:hypothetical protein n=1 Tax=Ascidiaceihabitans sp. TaxID=1872644 RepID=UPI003298E69F
MNSRFRENRCITEYALLHMRGNAAPAKIATAKGGFVPQSCHTARQDAALTGQCPLCGLRPQHRDQVLDVRNGPFDQVLGHRHDSKGNPHDFWSHWVLRNHDQQAAAFHRGSCPPLRRGLPHPETSFEKMCNNGHPYFLLMFWNTDSCHWKKAASVEEGLLLPFSGKVYKVCLGSLVKFQN